MISVEHALKKVNEHVVLGTIEKIAVKMSLGYHLAKDIYSPIDMPPFPQSAMDGYAVNFAPKISKFNLIGEIPAGSSKSFDLKLGDCVRIFTGSAVPASATTVVKQEDVVIDDQKISFTSQINQGKNIRPQAEQIKIGELALKQGSPMTPASIGFLSTLGISEIEVYQKPKVAILTTGDELVKPGLDLNYGQIYESNSVMLKTAFHQFGIHNITTLKIEDNFEKTVNSIKSTFDSHDFIILSGGISVGDYDFVGKALKELKVNEVFYKVKQKPGKPLYFGTKNKKVIL